MLRADLTDHKREMTITPTVNGKLVHQYEDKIVPGMGVPITSFDIAPKIDYDRGDCDCILQIKETSQLTQSIAYAMTTILFPVLQ